MWSVSPKMWFSFLGWEICILVLWLLEELLNFFSFPLKGHLINLTHLYDEIRAAVIKPSFYYYPVFVKKQTGAKARWRYWGDRVLDSGIIYQLWANHLRRQICGHQIKFLSYASIKPRAQYICHWTDVRQRSDLSHLLRNSPTTQ